MNKNWRQKEDGGCNYDPTVENEKKRETLMVTNRVLFSREPHIMRV
jgi:hypothetical protein